MKELLRERYYLLVAGLAIAYGLYAGRYGLTAILFGVTLLDLKCDIVPYSWRKFLPVSIPFLLIPVLFWHYAPPLWNKVVYWQLSDKPKFLELNNLFRSIPFNDGAFLRVYQPPWLTAAMRWVYGNGFALPVIVPVYRSFLAKDLRKILSYTLSAHILQFVLIFPFYYFIHLQEVWYVLGDPDGMARNLSASDAATVVLNCFPSMHTSVAFGMLLLALRERGSVFKWTWVAFCSAVIFSTMYLEIHWVLDVIAGMALAWVAVKLGDSIVDMVMSRLGHRVQQRPAEAYAYRSASD